MSTHPNLQFRITGYRAVGAPEKLSSGRGGHWQTDHHIFPEGSYEDVKAKFPVGSLHAHVPPPPCRYAEVWGFYTDKEARTQLACPACYPQTAPAVDNRRTS
jgi:hypothetical protein